MWNPVNNRFDSVFYYYLVVYCTHEIKMPNANVCRQADLNWAHDRRQ